MKNDEGAFTEFIDMYFPPLYHGKMGRIYKLFRHGLAHNYYPKTEFGSRSPSTIAFGVDERRRVVSLNRLRKDLDDCRARVLKLDPTPGRPFVLVPQVLFLDTVGVMERLKKRVKTDLALQVALTSNHKRVRSILRHVI